MADKSHKLRFNLNKPSEQEAWEIVQSVPSGKRNRFILDAILAYEQRQSEEEQQDRLAERIADKVVERLSDGTVRVAENTTDNAPTQDADAMEKKMQYMEDFLSSWA